jgi:CRISPR-associated endonuclease/helicase Cas3
MDDLLQLWGKTVKDDPATYHPALYHMLDAGHVARALLASEAPAHWKNSLASALRCDHDTVLLVAPWLVALHDLGKCSQAFQEMVPAQKSRLQEMGMPFSRRSMSSSLTHPIIGAAVWPSLTKGPVGQLPDRLGEALRQVVAGHHGFWLAPGQARQAAQQLKSIEPGFWDQARIAAAQWLWDRLTPICPQRDTEDLSCAIMGLTGFTILCDWLASDERFFRPAANVPPDDYLALSQARAQDAVAQAGFLHIAHSTAPTTFGGLFAYIASPRPLQSAVNAVPDEVLQEPTLAFIEAPTGEGKTEAALALAHRIGALRGSDALYYALPTMATSNSMYDRVNKYLHDDLGLDAQCRLVHGQAYLLQDDAEPLLMNNGELESTMARSWFAPLKKAVLAPFGVGTIDQAELAVLNVRHVALRCVGLAGKVVILDEVHAYDVYVTTIIERMLAWLRSLGSSVIVLSATLPTARRRALARAWGASATTPATMEGYPRFEVLSTAGHFVTTPATIQDGRTIGLGWLSFEQEAAEAKVRWLLEQVAQGGCACWITNTIAQAQALYGALRRLAPSDLPLDLIHSRFPLAQRKQIEGRIIERYGKNSADRRRGIVVGTQVLEQSLDLDFDLMVSDLAPIDLLLQRAGRLHRHARPGRPVAEARLWINLSRQADGSADLGVNTYIYAEYILRRTLQTLDGRAKLNLPDDYRPLIEAVYVEGEPTDASLRPSWETYQAEAYHARQEAEQRLVPLPLPDEPFCTPTASLLFQENEDKAGWGVAQTRLGAESITLVPLEREGSRAWLRSAELWLMLRQPCERATALEVLRHALRVSHRGLIHLLGSPEPEGLELFRHPLLRNLRPLWLQAGRATLGGELDVTLDDVLGLVIGHAEKGDEM